MLHLITTHISTYVPKSSYNDKLNSCCRIISLNILYTTSYSKSKKGTSISILFMSNFTVKVISNITSMLASLRLKKHRSMKCKAHTTTQQNMHSIIWLYSRKQTKKKDRLMLEKKAVPEFFHQDSTPFHRDAPQLSQRNLDLPSCVVKSSNPKNK